VDTSRGRELAERLMEFSEDFLSVRLAGAYGTDGQVKEAVALLKQVVKIREQRLAEDHPD
jgi:hypothetical protein